MPWCPADHRYEHTVDSAQIYALFEHLVVHGYYIQITERKYSPVSDYHTFTIIGPFARHSSPLKKAVRYN